MAAERLCLPCKSDEDLRTRPPDEQMSSNEGGSLNLGETEVPLYNNETSQDDLSGNSVDVDGVAICQYVLLGRCHFGTRCHLSHSLPQSSTDVPDSRHDTEQDARNRKKAGKMNKMQKRGKNTKEVEEKECTKKPRMRTADDVISRIMWDPSLDSSNFSVGYLDRFLGVLERPFSEFSWDTDICSCNYSEELALPRHRIQYFTYRGQRVWDRESRMDGVFGSTGGSLEPPFAAGGNVTQETRPQESGVERQKTCDDLREENYCANDGETYDRNSFDLRHGNDGEKENGDLPHTLTEMARDTQNNQKCLLSDTPMGQQEAGSKTEVIEKEAVEDPELSNLTAQMSVSNMNEEEEDDGEQEEWKDSWEDEQENKLLSWHYWPSSEQSSHSLVKAEIPVFTDGARSKPLEQRQKPNKWKPTHFIAVRADTLTFLSGFQHLQEDMTSLLPLSAPHWVSPKKLHITLCLLVLPGPTEVRAACKLLSEFARKQRQPPLPLSFPPKLGHFGGRVLFLTPQPLSVMQSLNKDLQKVYSEKGWLHMDSVSPNFHLTLAKMRGKGVFGGGVLDTYSAAQLTAIDFGKLAVNQLYLCVNGRGKREDSFYKTVCVVNLQ